MGGRLPSESEWEYAATYDGTKPLKTDYPWGNEEPQLCVTASFTEADVYCDEYDKVAERTEEDQYSSRFTPYGGFKAGFSPIGLENMAGSMAELVEDIVAYPNGQSSLTTYLLKGGSYKMPKESLKVRARTLHNDYGYTYRKYDDVGFRCLFEVK